MKLIYIGGFGRSGSTYLDLLLGQHSKIASGGEIVNLPELQCKKRGVCSCGCGLSECPVWGKGIKSVLQDQEKTPGYWLSLKLEARLKEVFGNNILSSLLVSVFVRRGGNKVGKYGRYNRLLFSQLAKHQGADVIVDSSKTTYFSLFRPLSLSRELEGELLFVHLVRDPLAVISSLKKGTNKALVAGEVRPRRFKVLRGFVGWMLANVAALINATVLKERSILIRYEDLVRDPKSEISKIAILADLDPVDIFEFIDGKKVQVPSHLCEGNRMGKEALKVGGSTWIPDITVKEKIYYFIFCSWLELLLRIKRV